MAVQSQQRFASASTTTVNSDGEDKRFALWRSGALADVLGAKAWQRGFRRVFESKGSLLKDILACASLRCG